MLQKSGNSPLRFTKFIASALLAVFSVASVWGVPQEPNEVIIVVKLSSGETVPKLVEVKIRTLGSGLRLYGFTDSTGQISFRNLLAPATYYAEINDPDYEPASEQFIMNENTASFRVFIFLQPKGAKSAAEAPKPGGPPVLAPKARKAVEKAREALRAKNYEEAEKHLRQALKLAPGHPFVNYLAGLLYFQQNKFDDALLHLERATVLDPEHGPSFALLGIVRHRKSQFAGAVAALERALVLNSGPWQVHWTIAQAYYQEKKYEKAVTHGQRARELSQGAAPSSSLEMGISLARLGEKERAITELENFLAAGGQKPGIEEARQMLSRLRGSAPESTTAEAETVSTTPAAGVEALSPADLSEGWAPPDVDASKPGVDPSVTCSLPEVLQRTAGNTAALLKNLEKIGAKEAIELYELDGLGNTQRQRLEHFDYVVWIREAKQNRLLFVEESRRALSAAESTVSRFSTKGIPALALVFHPYYVSDFEITCEGLGQWRGEPAWLVHFRQLDQKPPRLLGYMIRDIFFPVPVKGRAWIGANSYQVLRMETDMVKPIREIELQREHMNIEYKPVYFQKEKLELWLPESAEVYWMRRKQRLRLRHTFTDFMLFLVEMKQEIKATREPQEPQPF